MVSKLHLAVGIGCALVCQIGFAQGPAAQIKKTATPPTIDGIGNDAVWANANVYGTTTWFQAEPQIPDVPLEPSADITLEWRALWDNTNLYILTKVNDDAIVNSLEAFGGPDASADFNDDGIEFYIDAQDVNNAEYNPGMTGGPTEPTYQFTSIAGWTPAIANDPTPLRPDGATPVSPRSLRIPDTLPNTSFTYGINSYDGNDDGTRYPQEMGRATSGPITANPAGGFDWEFEASFPWEALEETPADILARNGIFGFGVAYNDDDDMGGRDSQYMWGTHRNDLWHVSEAFPDVQLVDAQTPTNLGDYNENGTVDAADYVTWRNSVGNPTLPNRGTGITGNVGQDDYNFWRARFGATSGAGAGIGAGGVPEPATIALLVLISTPWVLRRRRR